MQPPAAGAEGSGSPLYGADTFAPFKFHPSVESVDWSCLRAVDVDRVVQELDVATLQENLTIITFCSLEREACSRCGQPADAGLLKVLRLAQLTIQHLLHRQDCLSANVVKLEAQLQELGQELDSQTGLLMGARKECHRRKRMINLLQQLVQQTGAHTYHMCRLCDEIFMNTTFLWDHIQNKHSIMFKGGKEKRQSRPVQMRFTELRTKLRWSARGLATQMEVEKQLQSQMDMKGRGQGRQIPSTGASSLEEKSDEHARKLREIREMMKLQIQNRYPGKVEGTHQAPKAVETEEDSSQEAQRQPSPEDSQKTETETKTLYGALPSRPRGPYVRAMVNILEEKLYINVKKPDGGVRLLFPPNTGPSSAGVPGVNPQLQEERERQLSFLSEETGELVCQDHRAMLMDSQEEKIQTESFKKEEGTHQEPRAAETEEDSSQEAQRQLRTADDEMAQAKLRNVGTLAERKPPTKPPRWRLCSHDPGLTQEPSNPLDPEPQDRSSTSTIPAHGGSLESDLEGKAAHLVSADPNQTTMCSPEGDTLASLTSSAQSQASPSDVGSTQSDTRINHGDSMVKRQPPPKPPRRKLCRHDPGLTQDPNSPLGPALSGLSSTTAAPEHGGSLAANLEGEAAQLVSREPRGTMMVIQERDASASLTTSAQSQASPSDPESMQSDTRITQGDSVVKKQPPPKPPRRKLCRHDPGLTQETNIPLEPELLELSSTPATPEHGGSSEAKLEEDAVQMESVDTGNVATRMDSEDGDKLELSGIVSSAGSPRVLPAHRAGRRHPPRLKGHWFHRILKWWRNK